MMDIQLGKSREELKQGFMGGGAESFVSRMACALSVALVLVIGASAQSQAQQPQRDSQQSTQPSQDQQTQPQDSSAQPAPQSGQTQATPPPAASTPPDEPQGQSRDQTAPPVPPKKPKYAPQDANRPPYAKDYPASQAGAQEHAPNPDQYDPDQDLPPGEQGSQDAPANRPSSENGNGRPQNAPYSRNVAPAAPAPATLTIPAGTILSVRVNEYLSSDSNRVGDRVTATLQQPIVVNGYVVARRGQMLVGQVEAAVKAGRVKGTSQLGIELTDMTVADGQSRPILTELWKGSGGTSHGADAATIGGTTALGAAIGAVADWGTGAAIGAGAGAAAGIGAVLLTRGRPTVITPETYLTFRLTDPVTVDTTQSAQAFLPVSQYDYDNYGRRGSRYASGPTPPPYACAYGAPCYPPPMYAYPYPGYYYPYPSVYFGGYYGRRWYRW